MLKREWTTIFTNRKLLISIVAILFIPIMYGGTLLWAFWDPYKHLDDLPVAIVNNDQGAELDGKTYELGKEFVKKLKGSKDFNFKFVDHETGYKNLNDQKYYLLVEIPGNFSKNATTLLDNTPKKLELKYVPNESFNFLSAQIGETAMQKIQMNLQEKVTETYAKTMFDSLTKMANGFQSADDAAGKLLTGAADLNNGAKTLEEKLALLAEKQVEFTGGANKLESGTNELKTGVETLTNGLGQLSKAQTQLVDGAKKAEDGTRSLQVGIQQAHQGMSTIVQKMDEAISGTSKLNEGSNQVTEGLKQLQDGANSANQGATDVKNGIAALQNQLTPVLASLPEENQVALEQAFEQLSQGTVALEAGNANIAALAGKLVSGSANVSSNLAALTEGQKALQNGMQELNNGAAKLETGADQLLSGQKQLSSGLTTFSSKLNEAKAGGDKLVAGAGSLTSGVRQLEEGSKALANGSTKLVDGSKQLANGTTDLKEGSQTFKDGLNKAANESEGLHPTDETYNMVAKPVTVDKEGINKVPNYGTGIAPYFLSLGLFVGALMLSIVFPLREPVGIPKNGFTWFLSKFGVIVAVGIAQALLASGLLIILLGLEVKSVPLFILFSIITSLAFMALIQLLVTTMDNPGRFLAIIILILQLTTSAGTFPVELIPSQLQWLNHVLPMAYSVRGFKEVISSGNFSLMWSNGFVLLTFMISFLVLTTLYFVVMYKKSYSGVSDTVQE